MVGIAIRMFLDRWRSLLIYIFASLGFSEMYVALYPTLRDQLQNLEGFLEAFPQGFMEAFGFTPETMSFATVESLMATEMFSFIWPIILIILAASLANNSFAGDIEKGTIELTLAQPISRARLFLARYLTGSIILTAFVVISVFGIIPLAAMHGIEYNPEAYVKMTVLGIFFGLAVYSLGALFSTIFSEKGKANFALVGVLITMYALNIVARLNDNFEALRYTSFFNYLDPGKAMVNVEYASWALPFFGVVFVVGSALALLRFLKRDIAA
jgi:ABC-2 type transport system permease protein